MFASLQRVLALFGNNVMLLGACAVARCRRAQEASITRVYDTLPYGGRDERGHITLQYLNGLDAIMASRSTLEILSQYDSFLQNNREQKQAGGGSGMFSRQTRLELSFSIIRISNM